MTFIAIIGFIYGNPYNELKVSMMYFVLGLIGLGSTALHSTLNWIWYQNIKKLNSNHFKYAIY